MIQKVKKKINGNTGQGKQEKKDKEKILEITEDFYKALYISR